MTLNRLYDIAVRDGIEVYSYELPLCKSLSLLNDNKCSIAIDPFCLKSEADEKVRLAHELGHCETASFYNPSSAYDLRSKHERRADTWAIKTLIPEAELRKAVNLCTNRWELSEHFGVTENFMQKALDYYSSLSKPDNSTIND